VNDRSALPASREPLLPQLARRAVSIPAFLVLWLLALLLSPLLLVVALVLDVARPRRFVAVRCLAIVLLYFTAEVVAVLLCFGVWLLFGGWKRHPSDAYLDRNFRLQCRWASAIFWGGVRIFSLRVEVEGAEAAARGPVIVFVRHVSPVDNLIPAVFLSAHHAIRLRWVMNRWLLRDPSLDIVGHRLPNAFVRNGAEDNARQVAEVAALAAGMTESDGVVIFPEGTLFDAGKLRRIVERTKDGPYGERTATLRNVLPPRLGGALALLAAAPEADVVICAHFGLEPASAYRSFLRGALIGQRVRIAFWRVSNADIPAANGARIDWLYDQWQKVDDWVESARNGSPVTI